VMGKSKAVKVFEVVGENSHPPESNDEIYYRTYEEAFNLYLSREFGEARRKFKEALTRRSDDPAAQDMVRRIDGLDPKDLPPDWDGSIVLTSK
jgi:hypothetical protein